MVIKLFISHRGNGKHNYKENTQEAILEVLKEDISGVEFDVRITKDNELVLAHDPIFNGKIISLSNLNELNIQTLESLLKKIKTDKIILIEIKSELGNYKNISDRLINIINKHSLNIYISSFNKKIIDYLKKYEKVGLIIGYYINKKNIINDYNFNIVHYFYKDVISKNKTTFIWTINDKNKLKNINKNFYIITDKYYLIK